LDVMQKKTVKELVFSLTGMTIGVALMLPDIDLPRALGITILFVTGVLSSPEECAARRVGAVLLFLCICMVLVILGIYSGDAFAPPKGGPRTWYVVALVATWLICGVWEYGRWRGSKREDSA
jgi:hypothetical protein